MNKNVISLLQLRKVYQANNEVEYFKSMAGLVDFVMASLTVEEKKRVLSFFPCRAYFDLVDPEILKIINKMQERYNLYLEVL